MIGRSSVSTDPTENEPRVGVNAKPSATRTPVGTSTAAMLLRRSRTSASWSRSEYDVERPQRHAVPAARPEPVAGARHRAGHRRADAREEQERRAERPRRHRHDVLGARVEVVGGGDVHRRAVRDRRRVAGQPGERPDDEAARERDRGQHGDRRDQQRRDRARRGPARAREEPEPEPPDVGERERGRDDGHDRHERPPVACRVEEQLVLEEPQRQRKRGERRGRHAARGGEDRHPAREPAEVREPRLARSPSVTAPAVMNRALLAIACVTT